MRYFVEYYEKKDYNLYYPYGLNGTYCYGQIYCYRKTPFLRKIRRKDIYLVKKFFKKYSDDWQTLNDVRESVKKECESIIELLNNDKKVNRYEFVEKDKEILP